MAAFASAKKVESLEQQVSNLQAAVERQTALLVELRDQGGSDAFQGRLRRVSGVWCLSGAQAGTAAQWLDAHS